MGEMTMVERVARAMLKAFDDRHVHAQINRELSGDGRVYALVDGDCDVTEVARAILEASGHAEMVEALKLADDMLSRSEFVQSVNHAKIRSALAKATGGEG